MFQVLKDDLHPRWETVICRDGENVRGHLDAADIFVSNIVVGWCAAADPDGVTVHVSVVGFGHGDQASLIAGHGRSDQAYIIAAAILIAIDEILITRRGVSRPTGGGYVIGSDRVDTSVGDQTETGRFTDPV